MNKEENEQLEEIEDPIQTVYGYLVNGEHKKEALFLVQSLEQAFDRSEIQFEPAVLIAVHHIFATVYIWNDELEMAAKLQHTFLVNKEWCVQNKPATGSYLAIVFAKNQQAFIDKTLQKYNFLTTEFNELYKAYLSSIVNPNSEEHFSLDLLPFYQQLKNAQQLYCH
ncbi:MAG: hypothetical protein KGZ87_02405 [Bacteroidetes bacterium]|nr:hypothetical protein [Bacteroidota bacterium]